MFDAGFVSFLARRSIRCWGKSAELRQTICPRLSRNPRLGQDAAGAEITRGCHRENGRQIRRSVREVNRNKIEIRSRQPVRGEGGEHEEPVSPSIFSQLARLPAIFLP